MARSTTGRLVASTLQSLARPRVAPQTVPQWLRPFSYSTPRWAEEAPFRSPSSLPNATLTQPKNDGSVVSGARKTSMQDLINLTMGQANSGAAPVKSLEEMAQKLEMPEEDQDEKNGISQYIEPYHFHIYSHKHNTHITVTRPNRDAILSVSCGNIGFNKSQRKSFDAAYQLGNYVMEKLHQKGYTKKIKQLEVVLRGFGPGREAVTKVLLGGQAKGLRNSIVRVTDNTRLKFGGTRSQKPRRLG